MLSITMKVNKSMNVFFCHLVASILLAMYLFLPTGSPAWAQTQAEIDEANRTADQIQREQQERQQQQLFRDQQRGRQTPPLQPPEIKPPTLPKGDCRMIEEIVLIGVNLLPGRVTRELVEPYEDRCLYAGDIEKLLADILKAYIDRGYIAVRPYIQAQDLSTGRLEILILEGEVEGVILQDGDKHSVNLSTAFPFIKGKPLNLRDIEQGLDQVNRLASNNAAMQVAPGSQPGESVVYIVNDPVYPLGVFISLNNLGSPSTGRNQGSLTLSMDNPLHLNDFLTYTHSETVYESNRFRDSSADSLFFSLPFGYWTLQQFYSNSDYRTPVPTSTDTLTASGKAETFRTELNWVAYRDRTQKITPLAAINRKSYKNYLEDQFLNVSSRNLTILDLDLRWNRRFQSMFVNLNLGWSKGVKWFNALEDEDHIDDSAPHAQGSRIRFSGGLQVPFTTLSRPFSFSSRFAGQYALEPLYGSEQITIGSHYTVRGFNRNSLAGDRGYFIRNELAVFLPRLPFVDITPSLYLGLDGGRIEAYKDTDSANLSGAAAGIRFNGKHLAAEMSVAKSITVPDEIERESALFSANVTIYF